MTKEERDEAIENINNILTEATQDDNSVCYVTSDDAKWLRLAIEALEEKMEEKRKYKVTISCTVELEAEDADVAKDLAVQLFEIGPKIITSVECEETQ